MKNNRELKLDSEWIFSVQRSGIESALESLEFWSDFYEPGSVVRQHKLEQLSTFRNMLDAPKDCRTCKHGNGGSKSSPWRKRAQKCMRVQTEGSDGTVYKRDVIAWELWEPKE